MFKVLLFVCWLSVMQFTLTWEESYYALIKRIHIINQKKKLSNNKKKKLVQLNLIATNTSGTSSWCFCYALNLEAAVEVHMIFSIWFKIYLAKKFLKWIQIFTLLSPKFIIILTLIPSMQRLKILMLREKFLCWCS